MKTLMIVAGSPVFANFWAAPLTSACRVLTTNHNDALQMCADENPTHVLVFDCETGPCSEKWKCGNRTAKVLGDINPNVKIWRCGWTRQTDPDYLRLPITVEDIRALVVE